MSFPPVTIYQVADLAGVSHQTVSRVINASPLVADRTRSRVLKAIARLNYRPNKVARNLAAGRSALIGVITFAVESYGPSHLIISLSEEARKLGYHVVVASAEYPALEEVRRCAGELREHGVEAFIIIIPTSLKLGALETVFQDSPVIVMGSPRYHRYTAVEIDHELGSYQATQHLLSLGHRQIACVSGPLDWDCSRLRRQGWRRSLQARRLPLGPAVECEWSAEGGYAAAKKLIQSRQRVTAVVAANDQIALGTMEAFWEKGFSIPDDLSVIGFDNMPESKFFRPPLTTVHHDFNLLAASSLQLTTEAISNRGLPRRYHKIRPELVLRETVQRLMRGGPRGTVSLRSAGAGIT
jgi:DNA-binding LacI/PurR family transcriptional regulator